MTSIRAEPHQEQKKKAKNLRSLAWYTAVGVDRPTSLLKSDIIASTLARQTLIRSGRRAGS
jgi:hypothetical protein